MPSFHLTWIYNTLITICQQLLVINSNWFVIIIGSLVVRDAARWSRRRSVPPLRPDGIRFSSSWRGHVTGFACTRHFPSISHFLLVDSFIWPLVEQNGRLFGGQSDGPPSGPFLGWHFPISSAVPFRPSGAAVSATMFLVGQWKRPPRRAVLWRHTTDHIASAAFYFFSRWNECAAR